MYSNEYGFLRRPAR